MVHAGNTSCDPGFDDQELETVTFWFYSVLEPALCLFGMTGNILCLIAFSRKEFKGTSYLFLRSLLMVDFWVMLLVLMFDITQQSKINAYFWAFFNIYINLFLINALMCCSNLIIVRLSIERCMAICKPFTFSLRLSKVTKAKVSIACIMIVSAVLAIPGPLYYKIDEVWDNQTNSVIYISCKNEELMTSPSLAEPWIAVLWVQAIISRILPFFLLLVINSFTSFSYWKKMKWSRRSQSVADETPSDGGSISGEDRKLLLIFFYTVIVFFVTVTPAVIVQFLFGVVEYSYEFQTKIIITNFIEMLNYATNFYVYCLTSTFFRENLRKALCKNSVGVPCN